MLLQIVPRCYNMVLGIIQENSEGEITRSVLARGKEKGPENEKQ